MKNLERSVKDQFVPVLGLVVELEPENAVIYCHLIKLGEDRVIGYHLGIG